MYVRDTELVCTEGGFWIFSEIHPVQKKFNNCFGEIIEDIILSDSGASNKNSAVPFFEDE